MYYKYEQWLLVLPTHKSKISQTTQKEKMLPKSVEMVEMNLHWVFKEVNKLRANPTPPAVEEVALGARFAQFPLGDTPEQMEQYLLQIRETTGIFDLISFLFYFFYFISCSF